MGDKRGRWVTGREVGDGKGDGWWGGRWVMGREVGDGEAGG